MSQSGKSSVFRLAKSVPRERAIAAIWRRPLRPAGLTDVDALQSG